MKFQLAFEFHAPMLVRLTRKNSTQTWCLMVAHIW